jgi:ubiquinone/menaquinone biosynthesis C-methylase UbiE
MNKKKCPICNSSKHLLIDKFSRGFLFTTKKFEKITFDKYICSNCCHIFNKKIVNSDSINRHYQTARSNKILSDYEYKKISKSYYGELAKFITKETNFNKNQKYIDIGCGKGYLLYSMQKVLKTNNLYGLDMSLDAKNLVSSKLKDKIITGDFLNFKNKKFDVISIISILEHFDNLNKPIKKSYECLNDDGYLCITVPDSMKILYDHEGRKFSFMHDLLNYEHNHHFNLKNLITLFEKNKFKLVNYRRVNRGIWDVMDVIFKKQSKRKKYYDIKKNHENYDAQSFVNYYNLKKEYYVSKFQNKIKNKKLSIYGCGWWTTCVLTNFFDLKIKDIEEIIDKDLRKKKLKLFNKTIKQPDKIKNINNEIIVATLDSFDEIKKYLYGIYGYKIKLISFENNKNSFLN